jgi:hypothetical protein
VVKVTFNENIIQTVATEFVGDELEEEVLYEKITVDEVYSLFYG